MLILHYDYNEQDKFLAGIKNTELSVNMTVALNETVQVIAKYECPVNHYLESWDDSEIIPGSIIFKPAMYKSDI
jgi:hypothetical protein